MKKPLANIKMDENGIVWFCCRGQEPLQLRPKRAGDVIRDGQRWAEDALRQAKELLRRGSGPQVGREALRVLHNRGIELTHLLAGDDHVRAGELEDRFRAAWRSWPEPWDAIPEVEVDVSEEAFPFELLPVFDLTQLPDEDFDLQRASRCFLGIATTVRRELGKGSPEDHQLKLDGHRTLPLQFIRHHMQDAPSRRWRVSKLLPGRRKHDETGTDRELKHLRELPIALEGPWPTPRLNDQQVTERLVDALYEPSRRLDGLQTRPVPVQVHHFACHCDTRAAIKTDYVLRLSTEPGQERTVAFGAITRGYQARRPRGVVERRERAVVVFNACRSSHVDALSAGSFPDWFIGNGHRAFVGTLVNVPDELGAEWAGLLYTELLGDPPCTLGEATVRAARRLLEDFNNPLGLGYALYGETALSVAAEPVVRSRSRDEASISEPAVPADG